MGQITDAFKTKWVAYWLHVIDNPLSSLQGALSFIAIASLALAAVVPSSHDKIIAALTAVGAGIPKLLVGFKQKDPNKPLVTTPDNPTPHTEPSTEIPLNPEATIVKT